MAGIEVVFGGGTISRAYAFNDAEAMEPVFDTLNKYGVKVIDTARIYGESEEILGEANASARFTIDSKLPTGIQPGSATKAGVVETLELSLKLLKTKKLNVYYLHGPDPTVPIEDTLAGVNEGYQKGYFSKFGLSNYKPDEVEKIYAICKENSYPLPTVYQGNYSPVARKQENYLFPVLQKLGISFYAYSPLAGGFLTKTKEDILNKAGRFNPDSMVGKIYTDLYVKPSYLAALKEWESAAETEGCTKASLAYRWVTYNSALKKDQGDAIIVGASNLKQLEQTLEGLNAGPLKPETLKKIDHIWSTVEHEAPLDNFNK